MFALARGLPLACFAALACALGWAPYAGAWLGVLDGASNEPLGPALAAGIVCACAGRAQLRDWGRQLARVRASAPWYALAALAPIAIAGGAVLANHAFGAPLPRTAQLAAWRQIPPELALDLILVGFGEEAGWTAFAAPLLLRRHGFWRAWAIASALRVCWHLPLVWTGQLSWPLGLVGNASFEWLVLWMYQRSAGCWFLAALWHAVLNAFGGGFFFPMAEGADRARLADWLALGYALAALAAWALAPPYSPAAEDPTADAPAAADVGTRAAKRSLT